MNQTTNAPAVPAVPEAVRAQLHKALFYLIESEAKGYWRTPPAERETWAYHAARKVMRYFGLADLVALDEHYQDSYAKAT
jgi:hypothetical protein